MKKRNWFGGRISISPNLKAFVEREGHELVLHYAAKSAWSLYIGNHPIYRQPGVEEEHRLMPMEAQQLVEEVDQFLSNVRKESERYWACLGKKRVSFSIWEARQLKDELIRYTGDFAFRPDCRS